MRVVDGCGVHVRMFCRVGGVSVMVGRILLCRETEEAENRTGEGEVKAASFVVVVNACMRE